MKVNIRNTSKRAATDLMSHYVNMVLYGDPGAGKTTFLGSANESDGTKNILVIDIEGGMLSLEEQSVDYISVESFEEVLEVYDMLHRYCHYRDIYFNPDSSADEKKKARMQLAVLFLGKGISKDEAESYEPVLYTTVGIDSITELQKLNMLAIMEDVIAEHPDRDPDVPSVREWGKSGNQMRNIIRKFRSLKMHTIFVALPNADKDEKTGEVTVVPSLPGKLAREIPGFVDIVGHLKGEDDNGVFKNKMYTRPYGKH